MENRDSEPGIAGVDVTANDFSAVIQNFQVFTEEINRISRTSFEQNAKLIEELSGARDMGDIVAIQKKFMTGMFEAFNENVRLMMSRMAHVPAGMTEFAETWHETGTDLARDSEKASAAGKDMLQAGADAAQEAVQSGAEAVELSATAGRDAWQELAKAAAEILKAEPGAAGPQSEVESTDTPQRSGTDGDRA
jgi:hypothetical protein